MANDVKSRVRSVVDTVFVVVPVLGAWLWLSAWVWGGFISAVGGGR